MQHIRLLFVWFFSVFVLISLLQADEEYEGISQLSDLLANPISSLGIFEGEPSAEVLGCVNTLTGDFYEGDVDLILSGNNPLALARSYSSSDHRRGSIGHSWFHNHTGYICKNFKHFYPSPIQYRDTFLVQNGTVLTFEDNKGAYNLKDCIPPISLKSFALLNKVTNTSSGKISGRTNIKNHRLEYGKKCLQCTLKTGSGLKQLYTNLDKDSSHPYLRLTNVQKPNGHQVDYHYLNKSLSKIISKNIQGIETGFLEFPPNKSHSEAKNDPTLTIHSHDGRSVKYEFKIFGKHHYHHISSNRLLLSKVTRSNAPTVTYEYQDPSSNSVDLLSCKCYPDDRYLKIDYYKLKEEYEVNGAAFKVNVKSQKHNRVYQLKAPVGIDNTPIPIYTFDYDVEVASRKYNIKHTTTSVFDAYNHLVKYESDYSERLGSIYKYKGINAHILHSREHYFWGYKSDYSVLHTRSFENASGRILSCRTYLYDDQGNVTFDISLGNLTGKSPDGEITLDHKGDPVSCSAERYQKGYLYSTDGLNLVTYAQDNAVAYEYQYVPGTELLAIKLTISEGKVKLREFYEYDDNGAVKEVIIDNGSGYVKNDWTQVTQRRMTRIQNTKESPFDLPEIIEEGYVDMASREEVFLKKTVNHYHPWGYLLQQDIYDANHSFAYSLYWEYDNLGNTIKEVDALGQITLREYDANGNLCYEQGPNASYYKQFTYDYANRLTCSEDVFSDQTRLKRTFSYDYLGNKIASTDVYGNETRFEYDEFGHVIRILFPQVVDKNGQPFHPLILKEYDEFGHMIAVTDPNGNTTRAKYTVRGQPYLKQYPDGSKEGFEYTLQGELAKAIAKDGSYTLYTYDYLSRPIKIEIYSPLGELLSVSHKEYNAFHLISETDPAGYVTRYDYDGAGRLIRCQKEAQLTTYVYDSLGRQTEVHEFFGSKVEDYINKVQAYDVLNRVIELKEQDSFGRVLSKTEYSYDADGNCAIETTYPQEGVNQLVTEYDAYRRPILIRDALHNATHIIYRYDVQDASGSTVPYCEVTDPLGNTSITIKDALGRVTSEIKKNSLGQVIQTSHLAYDAAGNKVQQHIKVFTSGTSNRPIFHTWTYDSLNRLLETYEAAGSAEQKHTRRSYNIAGQLEHMIQPDGTVISYHYDFLGRLKEFFSSDESVHYTYTYDLNHQPTRIEDLIHGTKTFRKYDRNNQMVYEKLGNGCSFNYQLDLLGRLTEIKYPDLTVIQYGYEASQLKKVAVKNSLLETIFTHSYIDYDLTGNLTKACINKDQEISYHYDLLSRPTEIIAGLWSESILQYDKVGHPLQRKISDPEGEVFCTYAYDDLYQLKSERGVAKHDYVHDSVYNQVNRDGQSHTVNGLNQLLKDGQASYFYNVNGNRIKKMEGTEVSLYGYDALNRLTSVENDNDQWRYQYDEVIAKLFKRSRIEK